ncbi:hypothetical protein [Brevibacillus sp. 179-C9.3 HS]|uniref:hypothetical protein n=1 Tax=unclassified Brevibacillus TaxID=2684853 RepID=UPI0039A24967
MENALIGFISTLIVGTVIFVSVWWEGTYFSWKFTKWFFGILFAIALGVGGYSFTIG